MAPRGNLADGRYSIERRRGDSESQLRVIEAIERAVAEGRRFPPSEEALARLLDAARRDDGLPSRPMLQRLQILAKACALSRADRLDLAFVLLGRELESWNELTAGEAKRLSDAMEGFAYIAHLQAEQGRRWRYGRCPAEPCPMRTPVESEAVIEGALPIAGDEG